MEGVDYSFSHPNPVGLRRAGKQFVVRYLTGSGKALSPVELAALHKAGLQVGIVFETFGTRALQGYAAGVADAQSARTALRGLGMEDWPVFFAVDFDATDAQKPTIAKYLKGAVSVLGQDHVGVYGSYYVVKYMAENDICDWFWQTYAWSGGHVWKTLGRLLTGKLKHPSAQLYQYHNGVNLAGGQVDLVKTLMIPAGLAPVSAQPAPWYAKYGPRKKPDWFFPLIAEAERRAKAGAR